MKLRSTLLFAAASLSAAALAPVPAWAEEITLTNGTRTSLTGSGNTYSYTQPAETDRGGWLWSGNLGSTGNVAFGTADSQMKLSGTGIIAVGYQGGNGGVVYNFDFTNTNASAFSGKFSVVNEWDNKTVVKLSGTSWSNVEYVSAGVSCEQSWATRRSFNAPDRAEDRLELQGATTLAGITGVSKGYSYGNVPDVNAKELLTANAATADLTLSGSGEYAFYGNVGDASHRIGLVKTGTGTQIFGGAAKYFSKVSVSAGTLDLSGGTVSVSETFTTTAAATLRLGALTSDSAAIVAGGAVTLAAGTVFDLAGYSSGQLISGASISGAENFGKSNLRVGGAEITGRTTVSFETKNNALFVNFIGHELTWNGGSYGLWQTGGSGWTHNGAADSFQSGDTVKFSDEGSAESGNVRVSGTVNFIDMVIDNTNRAYTFSAKDAGATFVGTSLTKSGAGTAKIEAGVNLSEFSGAITVKAGTLEIASSLHASASVLFSSDAESGAVFKYSGSGELSLASGKYSADSANGTYAVENGTIMFGASGGTVSVSAKIDTGTSGTARFVLPDSGNATLTLNNLKGSGTLRVSGSGNTTASGGANSADTVLTLGSEFAGSVQIDRGLVYIQDSQRGSASKIILKGSGDGNDRAGINFRGNAVSFDKAIRVDGQGVVRLYGNNSGATLSGEISGTGTLAHTDGGSLTLSGKVALGGFRNERGNTTFSGETTISGEVKVLQEKLTFSGTGTKTIGSFTGPSTANSSGTVEISAGAALNVVRGFVLRHEGNGTSTLNVSGTMSVGGVLKLSRDGHGIANVKTGGTLIAGSLGFGQNWGDSPDQKSSVVNLETGGTLVADAVVKSFNHLNKSSFNLKGGTFGTSASSLTVDVAGLPFVLESGTTSTIDTRKYDKAEKKFTETGSAITIANVISGAGALTKSGAGTLTLSGANTYSGETKIEAGTLVAGNAGALGTGNVSVAAGGTLKRGISEAVNISGTLTTTGTATLDLGSLNATTAAITAAGAVTLSKDTVFDLAQLDAISAGSSALLLVSSTGTLTVGDSGMFSASNFRLNGAKLNSRATITVAADNNSLKITAYTAGANYNLRWNGGNSGEWTVSGSGWLKGDAFTEPEKFENGDTVSFTSDYASEKNVKISGAVSAAAITISDAYVFSAGTNGGAIIGSGTLTKTGNSVSTINAGVDLSRFSGNIAISAGTLKLGFAEGTTTTLSGAVSGTGTLEKTGAGTLVLTGTNTFTGKLLVSGGLVELGAENALGGSSVSAEVATGGILDLKGYTRNKYYGNYVLAGGTLINTRAQIEAGQKQIAGGITLNADSTVGGTHNFGMVSAGFGPNTLTLNNHTLTKTGTNEFFLTNTTITAGTINIQEGSITLPSVGGKTSNGSAATFRIGNAGTLTLSGTAFSAASITTEGDGTVNLGGGTLTLLGDSTIRRITSAGTVVVSENKSLTLETGRFNVATFTVGTGAKVILAGDADASVQNVISGAGSLEKTGAGKAALTGANTFTGGVTISAGTLVVNNNSALGGESGAISVGENGTLELGADFGNTFERTVSGTGTLATNADLSWTAGTEFSGSFNVKGGTFALSAESVASSFKKLSLSAGTKFTANRDAAFTSVETASGATLSGASSTTRVSVSEGSFAGTLDTVSLVKTGTGTLDMTDATFAAGGKLVVEGGTVSNLALTSDVRVEISGTSASDITFSALALSGGTLALSGLSESSALATLGFNTTLSRSVTIELRGLSVGTTYKLFSFNTDADKAFISGWLNNPSKLSSNLGTLGKFSISTDGYLCFTQDKSAGTLIWDKDGSGVWTNDQSEDSKSWIDGATSEKSVYASSSEIIFDESHSLDKDGEANVLVAGGDDVGELFAQSFTVDVGGKGRVVLMDATMMGLTSKFSVADEKGIVIKSGTLELHLAENVYAGIFTIEKNGTLDVQRWNTSKIGALPDLALGNALSGAGTLAHTIDSKLTLTGDRSAFTGTLDVQAGTVVLGGDTGGGEEKFSVVKIAAGAEVDAKSGKAETFTATAGTLNASKLKIALSGAGTFSLSSSLALADKNFTTLNLGDDSDFAGTIVLNALDLAVGTYDGIDGAEGKTVEASNFGGNASLKLKGGSSLNFFNDARTLGNDIDVAENGAIRVYGGNTGATISGNISGAGTLTVKDGGKLILSGNVGTKEKTLGGLTLEAGTLEITGENMNIAGAVSLAGTSAKIATKNGFVNGSLTLSGAHALTLGAGASVAVVGNAVFDGNASLSGTGTTGEAASRLAAGGILLRGNNTQGNFENVRINLGTDGISAEGEASGNTCAVLFRNVELGVIDSASAWSSSTALKLNNGKTTFDVAEGKTITLNGTIGEAVETATGTEGESGYVAATSSALEKKGAGTLKLTQANTNAGGTTVSAGTLEYALADGSSFTQNVSVDAGTLKFTGGTVEIGTDGNKTTLAFAEGAKLTAAQSTTIKIGENGALTGNATFTSEGERESNYGKLSFAASGTTLAEGDSLTLSNGVVSVEDGAMLTVAGTLTLGGNQGWTTVGGSGTLKLDGGTLTNAQTSRLDVSAKMEFGGNAVINTRNGNLRLTGNISESAGSTLTKIGTGTLTFTETVGNFAGTLVVAGGEIALSTGDKLQSAKALAVNSGAKFTGVVEMTGGMLTIASDAELSGPVTMTGGTLEIAGGTLAGNARFMNSSLTFGASDADGIAPDSKIAGRLAIEGSTLTMNGGLVSVTTFTWTGDGNKIKLGTAFGKSVTGTHTLIDFNESNLKDVDLTAAGVFDSGTENYGRRRLRLNYNETNTSLDVVSAGTLVWNRNVQKWGVDVVKEGDTETNYWTFDGDADTTAFKKNDYVMFRGAGIISIADEEIKTSGVVFDLVGAFDVRLAAGLSSGATLADADAGGNAGLSIYNGDITFANKVKNTMTSGVHLYGGSLTVYSADALGSTAASAKGLNLAGGTLKFAKLNDDTADPFNIEVEQNATLGSVERETTSTVDVAESGTVIFAKALKKATGGLAANLTKTGEGTLSLARGSEIDLLTVSAGEVSLTGTETLGVRSVSVAGTLTVEGKADNKGASVAFDSVTLNGGSLTLTDGGAFRAGTLAGNGAVKGTLAVGKGETVVSTTGSLELDNVSSYEENGQFAKRGAGTLKISGSIGSAVSFAEGVVEMTAGGSSVSGKLTAVASAAGVLFRNAGDGVSVVALDGGVALENGARITFANTSRDGSLKIAGVSIAKGGSAQTTFTKGNFEISGTEANFGTGSVGTLTISDRAKVSVSAGTFTAGVLSLGNTTTLKLGKGNTSATVNAINVTGASAAAASGATIDLSEGGTLTVSGVEDYAVLGSGKLTVKGVSGDAAKGRFVVKGAGNYLTTGGMNILLENATFEFDVGKETSAYAELSSIKTPSENVSGVVEKSGAGTLYVADTADALAFSGKIRVSAGTMRLRSRMTNADVTIADGATLTFLGTAATAVDGTVGSETYKASLAKKLAGTGTLEIAGRLLTNRVKIYSEDRKTWRWGDSGLENFNGTIAADGRFNAGFIFAGAALAEWESNAPAGASRDVALRNGGMLVFGGIDEEESNTLNHISLIGEGTIVGNARTRKDGTVVRDTFAKIDATAGSSLNLEGKGIVGEMTFADSGVDESGNRIAGRLVLSADAEWTVTGKSTGLIDIAVENSALTAAHTGALGDETTRIVLWGGSLTFAKDVGTAEFKNNFALISNNGEVSGVSVSGGAEVTLSGTFIGDKKTGVVNFLTESDASLTLPESALDFTSTFTVGEKSTISVGVESSKNLDEGVRVLSGAGTFEKTGTGTLSVSGDAGAIGTLAVSAGTVSFAANSKLAAGGAGTLSVKDGATVNLAAGADLSGFTLSGEGAVAVKASAASSAKLAGMTGAKNVSLAAGTLQVSGNISDSVIAFASGTALETTGTSATVSGTTLSGTALKLIASGSVSYDDTVTVSAAATDLTLQAGNEKTGAFGAAYSGNLVKTGRGTWTVSDYSFGVKDGQKLTVFAGTLTWENATFGTAENTTLTVAENATLQIVKFASGNELNSKISGSGTLDLRDCGTFGAPVRMTATVASAADTWRLLLSGSSYVKAAAEMLPGELFITDAATGELDFSGAAEMSAGKRVYVDGTAATLLKTGTGTLTLSDTGNDLRPHTLGGTLDVRAGTVVQAGNISWGSGTLNIAENAKFTVDISSGTALDTNRAKLKGAGTFDVADTAGKEYVFDGEIGDFTGKVSISDKATLKLTRETFANAETTIAGTLRVAISGDASAKRALTNLSGAGTLVIDAPDSTNERNLLNAVHEWGTGNTFSGNVQVKSGVLSLSAGNLGGMTAERVSIGGDNPAEYSERGTASGILHGGFLRITGYERGRNLLAEIFAENSKYKFTDNGGLILSGTQGDVATDSGRAHLFVTADGSKLRLWNGAKLNGNLFVARGSELVVTPGTERPVSAPAPGTASAFPSGFNGNSSINGDLTLNGTLTISVSDASLAAGTPLLDVGGNVVLDADSGSPAQIVLDLSGTSVSLDSVAVTILGGALTESTSALNNLVSVRDSHGNTWSVSREASGHLVLRNTTSEYHAPKGLSELFSVVKDTAIGDFIQEDLGKSEERLVALSPVSFGALSEMQSGFASLENDLLRERLEQRRYERAVAGDANLRFKPFVNVFGANREGDGNGTKSANYDMTHAGVFGGFDAAVSSNTFVGISVGLDWAKARLHDGAGKHEGNGSRLGVYGMSQFANAYFGYGLSAGGMSFETKRNTGYNNESVTGDTDGNDVNASFLFGAGWTFGGGVDFAPFVGLDISYAQTKSFTEKGGNATALDVEKTERWSVRGKVGAALNWRATDNLRIGLEASFAHEFLDTEADIDAAFASGTSAGTKFTSTAYLMDENTIQVGPRADFRLDETWSLSAAYTFETDLSETTTHSANVGLRARF